MFFAARYNKPIKTQALSNEALFNYDLDLVLVVFKYPFDFEYEINNDLKRIWNEKLRDIARGMIWKSAIFEIEKNK